MQKDQDIFKLMARAIFGEATPEEKKRLLEYLKEDAGLQQQFEILSNTLKPHSFNNTEVHENAEPEIRNIVERANSISRRGRVHKFNFKKYIPLAAAALLLFVFAGWFFLLQDRGNPVVQKPAFVAVKGSRQQVILPDGSKVWLNAGSKLFYVSDFKGASREVKLEGEGFFDVVKNASKPFIVHANNLDIKVLGTAFNVKAYENDGNVETTLYRGLINITKANDNTFQPIMLYPNQKIIVPQNDIDAGATKENPTIVNAGTAIKKSIIIQQIDSAISEPKRIETAWMYNRLEFRGDDFETLADKLERWYNVKIVFEDEKVTKLNFNGSFEKENIEQAMLALSTANSFNYKIKNNEILISSKR